jgi:predicted trehalose synthase
MKRLGSLALVSASFLALVGCENPSKLDKTAVTPPAAGQPPAAAPIKADHSGSVEERLARLEDKFAAYGEPLDFLAKVYAGQKAQQQEQERSVPAPDAVFAVDIAGDLKLGQVEGSSSALVTIVEAWDFA